MLPSLMNTNLQLCSPTDVQMNGIKKEKCPEEEFIMRHHHRHKETRRSQCDLIKCELASASGTVSPAEGRNVCAVNVS